MARSQPRREAAIDAARQADVLNIDITLVRTSGVLAMRGGEPIFLAKISKPHTILEAKPVEPRRPGSYTRGILSEYDAALEQYQKSCERARSIGIFTTAALNGSELPLSALEDCAAIALFRGPTPEEQEARKPFIAGGALEVLAPSPDDPSLLLRVGEPITFLELPGDRF